MNNQHLAEQFPDYYGPYDLYRSIYKYGSCGHTIGFTFYGTVGEDNGEAGPGGTSEREEFWRTYCDDLHQYGSWSNLDEHGILVTSIHVSSIVEGVDQCAEGGTIDIFLNDSAEDDSPEINPNYRAEFWQLCDDVEKEVTEIWNETHGCDKCKEAWIADGVSADAFEWDYIPVRSDCPECEGYGVPI